MEATSPTNTGVNMRRGIAALGAFAAVTALAACSGNTTPAATDNDTAATLTIWADDTAFHAGPDVRRGLHERHGRCR